MYLIRELAKLRFTSAREISFSLLACLTFTYKYVWNSIFLFLYVYTSLWLALFKYARSVITLAKLKSDFTRKARKECRALAKNLSWPSGRWGSLSIFFLLGDQLPSARVSSTSFTDAQFCGMTSFDWLIATSDLDLEGNRQRKRMPWCEWSKQSSGRDAWTLIGCGSRRTCSAWPWSTSSGFLRGSENSGGGL